MTDDRLAKMLLENKTCQTCGRVCTKPSFHLRETCEDWKDDAFSNRYEINPIEEKLEAQDVD
jgi:hypothetical protein